MSILKAFHFGNLALESAADLPSLFPSGTLPANGHICTAIQKRTGNASLKVKATGNDYSKLPNIAINNQSYVCIHGAIKATSLYTGNLSTNQAVFCEFRLGASPRCIAKMLQTGQLTFHFANNAAANVTRTDLYDASVISSVGSMCATDVWTHIAIEIYNHATVGYIKLYKNGVLDSQITGIKTDRFGTAIDTIVLGGAGEYMYWDDVIVTNEVGELYERLFIGDCGIGYRPASALVAGTMTPSAGVDHVAMVSELAQDGDATTLSGSDAGMQEVFTAAAAEYKTPICIIPEIVAKKTEVGTRELCALVNGVESVATAALSTDYLRFQIPFPGIYTPAQASDVQFGWKIRT